MCHDLGRLVLYSVWTGSAGRPVIWWARVWVAMWISWGAGPKSGCNIYLSVGPLPYSQFLGFPVWWGEVNCWIPWINF